MNDKLKFHKMTKPIKFRRIKLLKQNFVLWCKALRELINYRFNYILYKLNILKRYNYRDNVEKVIPIPPHLSLKERRVTSTYFNGIVKLQLWSDRDIDVDYFYRQKKDGSKKITYFVKDYTLDRLFIEAHLEDIHIKVGEWFSVDKLPVFKMTSIVNDFDTPTGYNNFSRKTVMYNTMKLRTIRHRNSLGLISFSDLSQEMLDFYYGCACVELENHLESLKLEDIMI